MNKMDSLQYMDASTNAYFKLLVLVTLIVNTETFSQFAHVYPTAVTTSLYVRT